jgi:3-hydroxyisobutyrate dehydrogenase-like beta-hydroxyacid dehydrogenase
MIAAPRLTLSMATEQLLRAGICLSYSANHGFRKKGCSMSKPRIGFVGVGLMGHGMAANLLKAGYAVSVIAHRNRKPVDDLIARGARETESLAQMTAVSDIIILCVTNSAVVEQVISDLLAHLTARHTIIDTSTADPSSTLKVAGWLAEKDVAFADAPLTGGAQQAEEGVLGVIVGADEPTFQRIKPVLSAFSARIGHFGPVGAGHSAKLINNYLVFAMVAAIADTYRVARRAGVDWGELYEVMKCGSNYSEALRRIVEPALQGDFDGYKFTLDNALKDISYYAAFAEERGLMSGIARQTEDFFRQAVADGHGSLMVSRLIDPATGDKNAEA